MMNGFSLRLLVLVGGLLTVGSLAAIADTPSADKSGPVVRMTATATFAGGCFWCMEAPFDKVDGVVSTTSGFIGGREPNPTYEQVSRGGTGYAEAVQVVYDPAKVSYDKLLAVFWVNVDPLDAAGQFCDRGDQYRTGIFYHDDGQKRLAEESEAAIQASGRLRGEIVTPIVPATEFYPAEEYHQDFYKNNPLRYTSYRTGCGRDRRLQALWGTDKTQTSH